MVDAVRYHNGGRMNFGPVSSKCGECGMMHPSTAPGSCPMARGERIKNQAVTSKNEKAVIDIQDIQTAFIKRCESLDDKGCAQLKTNIMSTIGQHS